MTEDTQREAKGPRTEFGTEEKKAKKTSESSPKVKVTRMDKFDFVIINCGYTQRLISHYLDLGAEFYLKHQDKGKQSKDRLISRKTVGETEEDEIYTFKYDGSGPDYSQDGYEGYNL